MRFRSDKVLRWLSGWLIAALLLAQQGAIWHAVEHLGSAQPVAAGDAGRSSPDGIPHELSCAKCLAFAALDHATRAAVAPAIRDPLAAAPAPGLFPRALPGDPPAACSRGPPPSFS